jgi:hypothetical protein
MFVAGWGSGGRDRFDTGAPLYRYIAALAQLRREHRLFSRGLPEVLKSNAAGAGALAWRMTHEGRSALVVLNSADRPTLLDGLDTGLPEGTVLRAVFSIEGAAGAELVVGPQGRVTQALPARGGWVWQATGERRTLAGASMRLALDAPAGQRVTTAGDFSLSGTVAAAAPAVEVSAAHAAPPALQLVVDGDLSTARDVKPGPDGSWTAQVDTSAMVDPTVRHHAVVWAPATPSAPAVALDFRVDRPWALRADLEDPAADDHGPRGGPGTYRYPTAPSWGANRQMDLRRVRVSTSGGALRLDLTLHEITTVWNPPHGFDHVNFTVFIELPGQPGGTATMPLQKGTLPEGMRWHRRLRVHGWTNALFTAEGASATSEGTPTGPAAAIAVDRATRTVSLTLPAASLGRLPSLKGARVYITTWDYDGGYRALDREPAPYVMGGGDPERDPLVMDDTPVIVLK